MVRAAVLFARGKRPAEAATAVNPAVPAGSRGNISAYGERVKGFHPDMWQSCVPRLQETQPSQEHADIRLGAAAHGTSQLLAPLVLMQPPTQQHMQPQVEADESTDVEWLERYGAPWCMTSQQPSEV